MAVKSAQRYWITCDVESCRKRVPSQEDEFSSFDERGTAEWAARRRGWRISWKGDDLCPKHYHVLR